MTDDLMGLSNRVRSENLRKIKPLGLYERQQLARDEGRTMVAGPLLEPKAAPAASTGSVGRAQKRCRPQTRRRRPAVARITTISKHVREEVVPEPTTIREETKREITMKNRLTDLNDHLFKQMERLGDASLNGEKLQEEITRSKAISGIARDIVSNACTVLEVQRFITGHGNVALDQVPGMLKEAPKQLEG